MILGEAPHSDHLTDPTWITSTQNGKNDVGNPAFALSASGTIYILLLVTPANSCNPTCFLRLSNILSMSKQSWTAYPSGRVGPGWRAKEPPHRRAIRHLVEIPLLVLQNPAFWVAESLCQIALHSGDHGPAYSRHRGNPMPRLKLAPNPHKTPYLDVRNSQQQRKKTNTCLDSTLSLASAP